jgi:hypothetical protein
MEARPLVDRYFAALGAAMLAESRLLADTYRHPGKLGENREALVGRFLARYLPARYGVSSGFALLDSGLSTQQDVVVYDRAANPVLFADSAAPLFPPSAVVALVEVKSRLRRDSLSATVAKTAAVKRALRASFAHHPAPPRDEALVMLFAFGGTNLPLLLRQLVAAEQALGVGEGDRLDMICVLGQGVIVGGALALATAGERVAVAIDNSLFVFYSQLLDYALARGDVPPRLMSYMRPQTPMGVVVAVS